MLYIGVDIGGMSLKIGVVNEFGEIISKFTMNFDKNIPQDEMIKSLAIKINEHIKENNYTDVKGIGVSCAGVVNTKTGYCDFSANLNWTNLDICGILKKYTSLDTKIANDANCAVLGEVKFGVAKNYHNVVMLTLGTGVGGGLYLDDKLYEGNQGKGAELGHSLFIYNGRKCACGLKGCFERYASASALISDTKKAMLKNKESLLWKYCDFNLDNVNGKVAFDCAKLNDKTAIEVVNKYISYLSYGILNFCNIFRPEVIILGGGISNQKENLIVPIKKILKENNYGYKNTPEVDVLIAKLGNDAGIIGAACLLMN